MMLPYFFAIAATGGRLLGLHKDFEEQKDIGGICEATYSPDLPYNRGGMERWFTQSNGLTVKFEKDGEGPRKLVSEKACVDACHDEHKKWCNWAQFKYVRHRASDGSPGGICRLSNTCERSSTDEAETGFVTFMWKSGANGRATTATPTTTITTTTATTTTTTTTDDNVVPSSSGPSINSTQDPYFGSLSLDVGVEGAAAGVVDGAVQAALASELGVEVGTIGIMNSTQSGSMLEMDFVVSQYGLRRSLKPPRRHW